MCTVLLPPGGNPIAVNKYIISYQIKSNSEPLPVQRHINFSKKSRGHIIILEARRVIQQVSSTNIRRNLKITVNKERRCHRFIHSRINVTPILVVKVGLKFGQIYLNAE
jgi:superfamily II helicase